MVLSDKQLAEKMRARLEKERERQRRWRSRQREKGMKSIAGMISFEAYEFLQAEKKRTGERISTILERAVLGLRAATPETIPDECDDNVSSNDTEDVIREYRSDLSEADIMERIEALRTQEGLPFNEIARRLNADGVKPFSDKPVWEGREVYNLLKSTESQRKRI